ncbi:MAG: hypothetical protein K0R15_1617 [Clostridiales bacterium]|jgi:predicted Mrr-cat superfamily restriction endonuclease|nr:hypothetical protein [Clostridiales bacterium]
MEKNAIMNINEKIWLIRSKEKLSGNKIRCDFEPREDLSVTNKDIAFILKNLRNGIQEARLVVNTAVAMDFVERISVGDFAIVTNRKEKNYISLVKITSNYSFDRRTKTHVREVDLLLHESRNSLTESFRNSLRKPRAVTSLPVTPELLDFIKRAENLSVERNALKAVFPLRPNFTISISIPQDMKKLEAERLAEFVRTLWQVE